MALRNPASVCLRLCVLTLLSVVSLSAAAQDAQAQAQLFSSFASVIKEISIFVNFILTSDNDISRVTHAFFVFAAVMRLTLVLGRWMTSTTVDLFEFMYVVVLIIVVQTAIQFYDPLTSAALAVAGGLGSALQVALIGNGDLFYAFTYSAAVGESLDFEDVSLWGTNLTILTWTWLLTGLMVSMSMVSFVVAAWGILGFALAKILGLVFVPLFLFEATRPLFDRWLEFLIGFLIYMFVARVTLLLTLLITSAYFGLPLNTVFSDGIIVLPPVEELGGMIAMYTLSLVMLLMTGRFAAALSIGFGAGTGAGTGLASIARTLAAAALPNRSVG